MANENILIIDDDVDICDVLRIYLEKNNFVVTVCNEALEALEIIDQVNPALIILDIMMPNLDGFELCQYIRKKTDVPLIFFSSKNEDMDKIIGLSVGADDFIEKSTNFSVVVAKVRAHLRRNRTLKIDRFESGQVVNELNTTLTFPNLLIKLESAEVILNDQPVKLSAKEYQLLCVLAKNPERIFSVEQLFDLVWGEDSLGDYRTVLVHISNLRKKLNKPKGKLEYIETFRGVGYKFANFSEVNN